MSEASEAFEELRRRYEETDGTKPNGYEIRIKAEHVEGIVDEVVLAGPFLAFRMSRGTDPPIETLVHPSRLVVRLVPERTHEKWQVRGPVRFLPRASTKPSAA